MISLRVQHALAVANALLLGILILSNATAAGSAVSDVVRARLIELVNEDGEMRAQLHLAENGGGELRLRGPQGEIRVKLGATEDGAVLLMLDQATEPSARLITGASGPSLTLTSAERGERVISP
jgi:hypothetical protein